MTLSVYPVCYNIDKGIEIINKFVYTLELVVVQNDNFSSGFKFNRVLVIYSKLMNGEVINKLDESKYFGVSERSIQRDIEDLRSFFADRAADGEIEKELVYDAKLNGYYLKTADERTLTNSEIFAVCKILLESRAFCKSDIEPIIDKLIFNCIPKSEHRAVRELISNEMYHYVEPRHGKHFIKSMWDIAKAVREHLCIEISYTKMNGETTERTVEPVGIMFSEFYFYLTAFIEDIDKKTNFKIPMMFFRLFTVLTEYRALRFWTGILTYPTETGLRRESSARGYSLCMAEGSGG